MKLFEHDRLKIDEGGFKRRHLNALLKLNAAHGFQYFDFIPDGIKFKQYVGIIQVDDLTIEILPKADKNDDESKWQDVLIEMLRACRKLKATPYGDANVSRHRLNLLELYFQSYLEELDALIRQGLVRKYRKERSNVNALKGKLVFSQHVSRNFVHKERFFTEHQVYDRDHALHQILREALTVVGQFTGGGWLADFCKRVEFSFPEVSPIKITSSLLNGFQLSRKTEPYRRAFEFARLILLNYSPNVTSGKEKMLALLFDMNKLWEEYVYLQLKSVLPEGEYSVSEKVRKYLWHFNYLEPDIVITNNKTHETIIIDTKWKRPESSGASSHDLRQMYAYNRFWSAEKAVLLYPGESNENKFNYFLNPLDKPEHACKMAFVSVVDEKGGLNKKLGTLILAQLHLSR
jgi:5-methylcytosine-specific restriction enzyme subunit McrC